MAEAGTAEIAEDAGQRLFDLLRDVENRCLVNAAGLPQQEEVEESWEGVLFSVGGRVLVAPLGEVKEILNYTGSVTAVPGTQPWVIGIANIRGNLLPISDLQRFLFGRSTVPGRRSRVLVVDHDGVYAGLLVDQMVGIRHFRPSDLSAASVDLPQAINRFVESHYELDGKIWPVFSMRGLTESAAFRVAAA